MIGRFKPESLTLCALVCIALLRGITYAALTPPWQSPDEFRHFEYVRLVAEHRRPVTHADLSPQLEEEIVASLVEFDYWKFGYFELPLDPKNPPRDFRDVLPSHAPYLYQPPLYYLFAGFILTPFLQQELVVQMYVVRFASLILGALTVIIAFLVARNLFPNDRFLRIGVPAFVAFLPMHAFVTASVNNDVMAEFTVSLLMLLLTRTLIGHARWAEVALIPLFVILAWYTKRTAAVIAIAMPLVATPLWWVSRRRSLDKRGILASVAVVAILVAILVAKGNSILALLNQVSPRETANLLLPPDLGAWLIDPSHYNLEAVRTYVLFLTVILESFWARFGWMNVRIGQGWYALITFGCLLSVAGLVLFIGRAVRGFARSSREQIAVVALFSMAVSLQLVIVFVGALRLRQLWFPENVPQGRYFFPVIVPIATLFMLGLREITPVRNWRVLLLSSLAAFLCLDAVSILYYIIPFYY